ncbi:MAG: citrate/2-methylcitrate synthase [Limosilactobacillus oris]
MGFGHRVSKTMDPRARLLGAVADELLEAMRIEDPLLDLARELADVARADDYFVERNLYPNVDFYSGVILRALGIPLSMYTVMFAIGRVPGWIANWREIAFNEGTRIYRPRQIYIGPAERPWIDLEDR